MIKFSNADFIFVLKVRHGAGTGLREVLKCHGAGGGKMVGSTSEQVKMKPLLLLFFLYVNIKVHVC